MYMTLELLILYCLVNICQPYDGIDYGFVRFSVGLGAVVLGLVGGGGIGRLLRRHRPVVALDPLGNAGPLG